MSRQLLFTVILAVLGGGGCAVSREDLCSHELPRLRADLAQEQKWVAEASAVPAAGRALASVSLEEQEEDALERAEESRKRAQSWALDRLALTQKAFDLVQRSDQHAMKPVLTRLNNELVSYYGYAADLNWNRMDRRLTEIGRIVEEVRAPLCE